MQVSMIQASKAIVFKFVHVIKTSLSKLLTHITSTNQQLHKVDFLPAVLQGDDSSRSPPFSAPSTATPPSLASDYCPLLA
jgi:hypothetical protein